MHPTLCSRCKKNVAVIFITKIENGQSVNEGLCLKCAKGLGIKEATVHPKATENIDEIIDIVKTLEDKGLAYAAEGDVYFRTKSFKDYGKLSHQPLEDLEAGARIDVREHKENPMDFALWKAAKPGEPSWESP